MLAGVCGCLAGAAPLKQEAARPEIDLAVKVGIILALGYNRQEIAKKLGVEAVDVRLSGRRRGSPPNP